MPAGARHRNDVVLADPYYYLKSFQAVTESLLERYADILDSEALGFLTRFAELPLRARALLVRMVMRKGSLFRAGRLIYAEIGEPAAAIAPLVDQGWVEPNPQVALDELFALLSRDELMRCLPLPRRYLRGSKTQLYETACAFLNELNSWTAWTRRAGSGLVRLAVRDLCVRLRATFFGNFHQDWTEFVLTDLGILRYEQVELQGAHRAFQTRRQLEDFHRLRLCHEMLEAGEDPLLIDEAFPRAIEGCDWLEDRRRRLLFDLAHACERAGALERALTLYENSRHRESAERIRKIHERSCRTARAPRPRTAVEIPTMTLTLDEGVGAVEHRVREHLGMESPATRVFYVENALINSLFGLLCWRAVFAPLPGAFFHAFQHAPADLSSPNFFERRANLFEECFEELERGSYKHTIRRHFVQKAGLASPFVSWGLMTSALLELALDCFPPEHLRQWVEWIGRDVPGNRSGFPDLVQFWPAERRYRMIEVKGPNDRLQENQRRCLDFCRSQGMPVAVCFVRWSSGSA